jgi:Arc/MetJ-type ribon-helix-helix transcriptional regulator
MPYQLPPDVETALSLYVSSGVFPDVEQALRAAVSALNAREREIAAIQEGIDAYDRGEYRDIRDFSREFCAEQGISFSD